MEYFRMQYRSHTMIVSQNKHSLAATNTWENTNTNGKKHKPDYNLSGSSIWKRNNKSSPSCNAQTINIKLEDFRIVKEFF